jgi:hypothetical protein
VSDYRLALRSVPEWGDEDRMDDIVVNDVACFRMEQMNANDWWMQLYLDDNPDGDYITFAIYYDKKLRELIVKATEYPSGDHVYEEGSSTGQEPNDP